ncbi:hypothetical protein BD289DRAFT_435053 [Coniella lustricola]|uniref:Uncharacterized protein n=1 Tax=Coniella lustricola TaxID=2025994 RepID=A0A2T3A6U2_9PEZI|nr:hypothetical protein BD289DRAFT_435053 [Coniella lustricola]
MATKRGRDSDEAPPAPSVKRARNSGPPKKHHHQSQQQQQQQTQEPATDITYGQRCCFPGLNESGLVHSDEDIDFEDETDALAYLQSVRQQASGIPHLLVAPRSGPQLPPTLGADEPIDRRIYTNGYGDTRGYYQDGAYTATPDTSLRANHRHRSSKPFQDQAVDYDGDEYNPDGGSVNDTARPEIATAYFDSLQSHFSLLRARLHQTPPPTVLAALRSDHSPNVGRFGRDSRTFAVWSARLRNADPHPAQVAAMDKPSVLRVLRVLLSGKFLRSGVEMRERTSRWLWALLARLPDRGEMDHTEVGHVRELGKRAALLMHTLREMALLREEVELGEHDEDADAAEWLGSDDGEAEELNAGEAEADAVPHSPASAFAPASPSIVQANVQINHQDMEDGEITDEAVLASDFEAAKARLLARLEASGDTGAAESNSIDVDVEADVDVDSEADYAQICGGDGDGKDSGIDSGVQDSAAASTKNTHTPSDPVRARMNMRATLNMILTVAGEFYGQRDLLEFRDPFHGI